MKIRQSILLCSLFLGLSTGLTAQAGEVKVQWHEPESYTDVRAANGGNKVFRERVFKNLEKHFNKVAGEVLPEHLALNVKVTNLNLAGDVRYNYAAHRDIRLVKRIYWPSIEFEYQLLDQGNVIKTEQIKLKDMSFMDRGSSIRNRGSYYYEKRIITDWFIKEIKPMLAQLDKQKTAVMSS